MSNIMKTSITFIFNFLRYHTLNSKSSHRVAFQIFFSNLNIGTDIAMLLLLMPCLQKLKMSRQQTLVISFVCKLESLLVPSPFKITLLAAYV